MSGFDLSPEQKLAAFFPNGLTHEEERLKRNLVIEAGAGAGKTRVLTERVRWLLCTAPRAFRLNPSELILVTFSKAADEELRHRVETEIQNASLSEDEKQRIITRLHISTIDSLFMQIVNNIFPTWWEQTKSQLPAETLNAWKLGEQRFPPAVSLVTESELVPELSEEILTILHQHAMNPSAETTLLDFILAGAFQSNSSFSNNKTIQPRLKGLERIAAAMLHENLLREDAPPLKFALERIHPSSLEIIALIRNKARQMFHKRLMHGRMTHNDRMLFLYHLLCLPADLRRQGFFAVSMDQLQPLRCSELIVDEYQDTNEMQHDILSTLLAPESGRMVVVGDPKQSIYGFRSAHVGVFQRLKTDPHWKLIELTRNYRSHPDLLPFINLLSDMTFSYRNSRIPEEFHQTVFALTAQQTFVGAKSLDAGRSAGSQSTDVGLQPTQRILLLGASLNKARSISEAIPAQIEANAFAAWALARELKSLAANTESSTLNQEPLHPPAQEQLPTTHKRYAWSEMVVLCETNSQVAQVHSHLQKFGIPATARLSRPVDGDSQRIKRSEELGLLLAKWLCCPLDAHEFGKFLWSGWLDLSREQTSLLLKSCGEGLLDESLITQTSSTAPSHRTDKSSKSQDSILLPEVWHQWGEHLKRCRTLASRHFFSAWQLLRWGFVCSAQNLAMENTALALHNALEAWSLRHRLEKGGDWPEEFLAHQLQQMRLAQTQADPTENAVTVCTVHGAKGLEWPLVVFWPNTSRERPPENFVVKSHEDATYIKWLAEDKESASLVRWIDNPDPPADRVAIQSESGQGEQIVRWSTDLQEKLEQEFERQRVFYTAFTRAREMLIVMSPAVSSRTRSNLRDRLAPLKIGDAFDPVTLKLHGLENHVLALFADAAFDLRKEAKRGAKPPLPWTGLDTDANCKVADWSALVRMRDYSPAWLDVAPEILSASKDNQTSQTRTTEMQFAWLEDWLKDQHQSALQSPWQKSGQILPPESQPTQRTNEFNVIRNDASGTRPAKSHSEDDSPAQAGLRFHAYMEHAGTDSFEGRGFLQKLLSAAVVREHELEMWSASGIEQSHHNSIRNLIETQRRIIDLFCVVDEKFLPKMIWNSPCLQLNVLSGSEETTDIPTDLPSSAFRLLYAEQLALHPRLHLVIDFKTGAPSEEHLKQMRLYLRWIRELLETHPQQLVNDKHPSTLFTDSVRPLMGIIYYSSISAADELHNFAQRLVPVDKNASVLFISPE